MHQFNVSHSNPNGDSSVLVEGSCDRTSIQILQQRGPIAPAELLGVNLELVTSTTAGLLSDRLENPKFCGPANQMTGLAPCWQPLGNNMGDVHNALDWGTFLSGDSSQKVHSYAQGGGAGILQTGRFVEADEELEVELWAKVRHHPVTLVISLRPEMSRAPAYCEAEIEVNSSYWKCYKFSLKSPKRDENASFFVVFKTVGVVHFDQIHLRPVGQPLVAQGVVDTLQMLALPTLRFPGGCMSTNYHWRLGIGPVYQRPSLPDPVFKQRADYDFGIDEYLALCQDNGIRPFITLNIGTGIPTDAGAWAKYCSDWYKSRELPLPEIYFQLGNEQYGSWETSHMNAQMYLEAIRAFVPEIRENYPRPIIIGLGEPKCSGVAGQPDTNMRELVLREAQGLIDVIAINRYKGQWFDDAEEQLLNVTDSVEKVHADLVQLIEDCRNADFPTKVALTEWGYWLHACHWDGKGFFEPDDALHGLFVSGMLNMMARLSPNVELGAYYHLINSMGMIRNDGGQVSITSIAEIFQLYRPAFPAEVLTLKIDSLEIKNGVPQVDVLILKQGSDLWAFASNRSLDHAAIISIEGLSADRCHARLFSAENSNTPLKERAPLPVDDCWELPPLSLSRISCPNHFHSEPNRGDG